MRAMRDSRGMRGQLIDGPDRLSTRVLRIQQSPDALNDSRDFLGLDGALADGATSSERRAMVL